MASEPAGDVRGESRSGRTVSDGRNLKMISSQPPRTGNWGKCGKNVLWGGMCLSTGDVPERWVWFGGHVQAGSWCFAEGEEEGFQKP